MRPAIRKAPVNVTGRNPYDVTFRDFTKATGQTAFKVWASSTDEARNLGRLAAYHDGLLPEVLDVKRRKVS